MSKSLQETAIAFVSEMSGAAIEDISLDSVLKADPIGLDSLDDVELCMMFEEEYDINIDYDEMENVKTVQDIVTLLESKGCE